MKQIFIFIMLLAVVSGCAVKKVKPEKTTASEDAIRIKDLRCEYLTNPLGIDETIPRLSWKLTSDQRNQKQTAYRLLVASGKEQLDKNRGDLWDTGKVKSNQSIHIEYQGKPLKSRMHCFWKAMVWDKNGKPSSWSKPNQWTMGLLKPSDWQAKWIGMAEKNEAPAGDNPLKNSTWIWYPKGNPAKSAPAGNCFFRKKIRIDTDSKIKKATLTITADNEYRVWLNDSSIGRGSNFNSAQSYYIKDKLIKGQNIISVKAVNAGDSPNPAGMIASLAIAYSDGKTETINTDKQWRCARKTGKDWRKLSFDDSIWTDSKTAAKFGGKPWGKISPKADRITPARYFRTEFKAKKQISKATAYICGLGYNKLFINGNRIGNRQIDPILRDYSKQSPYSVYDVTEHVKKGSNAIGVILGNGRFYPSSLTVPTKTGDYGLPRLLLQLEITYTDGSSGTIVSNNNWTATDNGPIRKHSDYNGETYDARMEMPGWNKAKFNESAWQKAVIVQSPKGKLTSSSLMQPMRITGTIKPVKLTEPKPGVWVFDLGQNIVGWCSLKIKAPAGTTVKMHFSENLYPDGMIDYRNLRAAKCTDYYICKGKGLESYRPSFTYHGFRYIEVTGLTQKPTLDTLLGEIVNTDMPFAGDFQCSDPTITQILKNARWGIRGNYLSIPTDCPQRDERQGWQGDRAAEQLGETFLFNNQLLYEKWMGDIRDSQRPDGNLSDVCPNYWPLYKTNVTWPACFVIVPGNIYRQNGDIRAIQRNYPYMAKWIDHLRTFVKDGIIEKDNYGDWCVPPESKELIHSKEPWRKTPKDVMATTYYYHILTRMADYAQLQGLKDDVKKYKTEAAQIKRAFNKKLYNKEQAFYGNGSQTSQILPLRFGMVPKNREKKIFDYIVNHIETKTGGAIGTGLIGGQWLMRSLSDNGRIDIAYRFATRREYPSWGYMIENGATTIWELWNGNTANPAMNSGNHVMLLGDLVIWMFEYLGGIQADITQPGFKHIVMNPQIIGDLTFASAKHDTPYGKIKSHWNIADGNFKWNITIPVNTTATVYIPAKQIKNITESGQNISDATGIKFLRMENNKAVLSIDSGSYKFVSKHQ